MILKSGESIENSNETKAHNGDKSSNGDESSNVVKSFNGDKAFNGDIVHCIVLVLVLAAMICVWPMGLLRDDLISRTAADYSANTGPIGPVIALQEFIPKYKHIRTIGVDIGKYQGDNSGIVTYHFYDGELREFAAYDIPVSEMKDGELTDIPVNLVLVPGERYYIGIDCRDYEGPGPVLHYRSLSGNGPEENIHFYYGPQFIENASANIRYTYEIPLKPHQILFYDSFVILVGVVIVLIWKKIQSQKIFKTE